MSLLLGAHYAVASDPPAVGGFSGLGVGGASKRATVTLNVNGSIYGQIDQLEPQWLGYWLTPQAHMADYEVKCTPAIGDGTVAGSFNWVSMSLSHTWSVGIGGGARFIYSFRRKVDQVVVGSGDLFAEAGGSLPDIGP